MPGHCPKTWGHAIEFSAKLQLFTSGPPGNGSSNYNLDAFHRRITITKVTSALAMLALLNFC